MLTNIAERSVAIGHMFLVTPTDGAAVYLSNTFGELDDVNAVCVDVTRIADHACQTSTFACDFHGWSGEVTASERGLVSQEGRSPSIFSIKCNNHLHGSHAVAFAL